MRSRPYWHLFALAAALLCPADRLAAQAEPALPVLSAPPPSPPPSAPPPLLPPQTSRPVSRSKSPLATDRVAGQVLSAADGHPIPSAIVTLNDTRSGQTSASARTDADGRYRFDPQPAGKYSIRAAAPGYLSAAYQEHDGFSTAIVLGAGLATDGLTLSLTPSAIIAGRVLDEAGDPVQHGQITLYRENANRSRPGDAEDDSNRIQRTRTAQTNDDGTFEFAGVAPGRFFLSANAVPWYATHPRNEPDNISFAYRSSIDPGLDVAYPELFYPNSLDPAGASPITIKGGEQITANLVMQPEHALTLTVRMPSGNMTPQSFPQLTRTVFGITEPVQVQGGGNSGQNMLIVGIPPGRYNLQTFLPNNRFGEDAGSVDLSGGSTTIDMPAAGTTSSSNVKAVLHSLDGSSLPADIQLNLRSIKPSTFRGGTVSQHLKDTNEATLPNVPPGDYRFSLFGGGRALTLTGLTVDGKKSPDTLLRISGKGDLSVDLTVTAYAPSVEGFARHEGKGVPGSMTVLVPAGADISADLFRRDQSDLDGSFTFRNVVPGNYLLVAIDDGWKLPKWNDAAALTPYLTHATPVTIAAGGSNTVHLSDPVTTQPR